MQVTCTHCGYEARFPDEKVPEGPFAYSCPKCKEKVRVDPSEGVAEAAPAGDFLGFEPLAPLSHHELELVREVESLAHVVALEPQDIETIEEGLRLVGITLIRRYDRIEDSIDALGEAIPSLIVIRMAKVPPPPCEPLRPLLGLTAQDRRRTVVAVVGENVRSLDGQTAFFLHVNCLIASHELERFPNLLRRAWLFHLSRYRYWKGELGAE